MRSILVLLASLAFAWSAYAAPDASKAPVDADRPDQGWFFYDDPAKAAPEEPLISPVRPPAISETPDADKDQKCARRDTWTVDCGFIDPGLDFTFQSLQRDKLLEHMALSKNDPKAVENFQRYMRWAMNRSIEIANTWTYNLVQKPELDGTLNNPVSTFGLRLMTEVRKGEAQEIFEALKNEGAILVYFSREDCAFCHQMRDVLNWLERDTGLVVWNAPLDGKCMPGYEDKCQPSAVSVTAAQILQVSIVPTIFLYVPENTWIRIATGVSTTDVMASRIVQFFTAYRKALLSGVSNADGATPTVDFSTGSFTEPTRPQLPTNQEIERLFKTGS